MVQCTFFIFTCCSDTLYLPHTIKMCFKGVLIHVQGSGADLVFLFCLSSKWGSALFMKMLHRETFFCVRVDLIKEGVRR